MIKLLGLGLSIDTLTIGVLYRLLTCDKIYLDTYTSIWFPSIDMMVDILSRSGAKVIKARRNDLEGEAIGKLVEEAKYSNICIAVVGDPMIATTHSAIVTEALSKGIDVEIASSTSILSIAISTSCLQVYRFGKPVTIVKQRNGVVYEYPFHVIKANRERNLHTLVLLEIDLEKNYLMTPREALEILLNIQKSYNNKLIEEDDRILILKAIGSENSTITIEKVKEVLNKEYEPTLYTIIIPAKTLHPVEEECIQNINKLKLKPVTSAQELEVVIKTLLQTIKQKLI